MMPTMRSNNWIPAVFNDLFYNDMMPKANCTAPAINVKESDKAYTVELAAPGMNKQDFNVHINDEGNLVVKMEHKEEHKEEENPRIQLLEIRADADTAGRREEGRDIGEGGGRRADRGTAEGSGREGKAVAPN